MQPLAASVAHAGAARLGHQGVTLPGRFRFCVADLDLLLLLQGLIDLLHPRHAALNRGQHLLLQQADLLFSVGMLDLGAAQGPAGMTPQDSFNRLLGGLQQQEWILLG